MTYFLDGLLVIMFNLGFGFPELLTILWMLSILLVYSLGKIFLIFKILLINGKETCAYNLPTSFLSDVLLIFLKYLEILLTYFWVLVGTRDSNLIKLTGLSMGFLPFEDFLVFWILGMNLDTISCLNVLLSELVVRVFYPELYIVKIKFQATLPILLRSGMSLALLRSMFLFLI